jgi:hypothetical protein
VGLICGVDAVKKRKILDLVGNGTPAVQRVARRYRHNIRT